MMTPEQAEAIARSAHEGQLDDSGIPVIEHVAAVAAAVPEDCKVVAWLHDVLEDTDVTYTNLVDEYGIDLEDLHAIWLITRRDNEPYRTYLNAIAQSSLGRKARIVKLADNLHNQSRPNPRPGMLERYKRAEEILRAAMKEKGEL
jgi:(p)ppGpp synthase/HD superfamily hydrolase